MPPPGRAVPLDPAVSAIIVDHLALAVFVFRNRREVYANEAANQLRRRLRLSYRTELDVLLRNQLRDLESALTEKPARGVLVTQLTAPHGEPFYVHVIPLPDRREVAVTVKAIGAEMDAVRRRYALSAREAQVAELVVHGYSNRDIAAALGMAPGTAKKHLTRIFDKVGVDSRSRLQTRLA